MAMPPNIPKSHFLSASRHKTRADQPTTVKNRGARLSPEDYRGLTPLIYAHITPYGRYDIDLEARTRIDYERIAA